MIMTNVVIVGVGMSLTGYLQNKVVRMTLSFMKHNIQR